MKHSLNHLCCWGEGMGLLWKEHLGIIQHLPCRRNKHGKQREKRLYVTRLLDGVLVSLFLAPNHCNLSCLNAMALLLSEGLTHVCEYRGFSAGSLSTTPGLPVPGETGVRACYEAMHISVQQLANISQARFEVEEKAWEPCFKTALGLIRILERQGESESWLLEGAGRSWS